MSIRATIVLAAALACCAAAQVGLKPACPHDWAHRAADDSCYRVFPNDHQNSTMKVRVTFDEATAYCASQGAVLPVMWNASLTDFIAGVVGKTSGEAVWNGIRADPSVKTLPQVWKTDMGRTFTEHFDWDLRQQMPQYEDCVALHMGGDIARRIVGGNNKMVTIGCQERLSVVCQKLRVPVHIRGVNQTQHGVLTHVWNQPLSLDIIGGKIPAGTRVTLQTTTPAFFATGANVPTNCRRVQPLTGASLPLTLNVTTRHFAHGICNGTCDVATVSMPAATPFVRGAKYSLCFFVPGPFAAPNELSEYGRNLVPNVIIEVIQKRSEYLMDVCTRHQHSVQLFFGAGHVDTNRDKVSPFYFNSRHESA
jgi:hypothetical protein